MGDTGKLENLFNNCMPYFIALGDEVRLHIIQCLTEQSLREPMADPGMNVKEITERTSLSRPAVSHHLKILRESGLVDIRRVGTCNYYYPTLRRSTEQLMELGQKLQEYFNTGNI